jgi:hypothetical protein
MPHLSQKRRPSEASLCHLLLEHEGVEVFYPEGELPSDNLKEYKTISAIPWQGVFERRGASAF